MIAKRSSSVRGQRGIALLTALFVVALATIAAVALVSSSSIAIRRTGNLQDSERAWWYADGAESWVKSILAEDLKDKGSGKPDSLADIWAQPIAFLPIDQGGIRGQVIDLQGLFNLNNLGIKDQTKAQAQISQFKRLLENIKGIDPFAAEGLSQAIRDWIDADEERSGADGAEDSDYLSLNPPYRAANQPFRSVSELMAIRGMTADLYTKLLPYVCALPTDTAPPPTKININTAPLPVLMSLSAQMDAQKVESFVGTRKKEAPVEDKAIKDGQGILPMPTAPELSVAKEVQATSSYFELQGEVVVGSARVALYSVFYRPPTPTSGSGPIVISHSTDTE